MSFLEQKRNKLEQMMKNVPGFGDYQEREKRRDTDKIQRTFVAETLAKIRLAFLNTGEILLKNNLHGLLADTDRVSKIFDRIGDKIRYASYGYTGLFDVVKIDKQDLDMLIDFDISLIEYVQAVDLAVQKLNDDSGENEIAANIKEVEKALKELENIFAEREQKIKGGVS